MSVTVSVTLCTVVLGVVVSCSSARPGAGGAGTGVGQGQRSCVVPEAGCPCTPGSVVACGKRVDGNLDFIYCYEGSRHCSATGVYGDCVDGSVVAKSLTSPLHTSALGTPGGCAAVDTGPLRVCTSGKRQGEYCASVADCAAGTKKCLGGANDGSSCKKEKDCADPGACTSFDGTCSGGTRSGFGCDTLADCPGGVSCDPAGGGGACGNYSGICDNGSEDGEACNADIECLGGGQCKTDKHGHCNGGKENKKKCRHNKHCKGGASCSAEDPGVPGAIDPCDPYCNVTADTATGINDPGFVVVDGGLVPTSGVACGDSVVSPPETCDDGNATGGDGCSAACKLETGFQCPVPGSPCTASTCGNGVKEGLEGCDDGNIVPYDGCAPDCTNEVSCASPVGATAQACVAICGDGIKFPTEACDDGNTTDGDGCSSTCAVEAGATCVTIAAPSPPTIDVPALYRDFAPSHPDFQSFGGPYILRKGIPSVTLAADKEPVFSSTQGCVQDATSFDQWWHDAPGVNKVILGKSIRLQNVAGSYVFDSANDPLYGLTDINCGSVNSCKNIGGFYPLNGLGWGNYAATGKNYHFTSEVRFPFTYAGGEVLSFTGDDDVFVYIGGKKVVDIGGIHAQLGASVTLSAATDTDPVSAPIALVVGSTYEIAVFQAERLTTGSNYKLTLQGFNRALSSCAPPLPPRTFVRDFEGVCPFGSAVVWQLFRWKAGVGAGQQIDFRAATAASQAALPASPPPAAPASVPIGTATPSNSPAAGPVVFVYDTLPGPIPVPVSQHLQDEGLGTTSQRWLRVYMTFTGTPSLFEWQQLFDCVPSE